MISNHPSPSIVQAPASFTTPAVLPHEHPAVTVAKDRAEPASVSGTRSSLHMRHSLQLPGPSAGGEPTRIEMTLSERQEQAGNIHNSFCLIRALEEVQAAIAQDPSQDVAALLQSKQFPAHAFSTFGRAYGIALGEQVSVAWFLRENQMLVPEDSGQLANLIAVCKEPLPEPVEHGNYWGLLSQTGKFDSEKRTKLSEMATAELAKISPGKGIISIFHEKHGASIQGMNAAQVLEYMMGSAEVRGLGNTLETALNDSEPRLSPKAIDWVMAAMVLELDPQAGKQRGVVAGYDLYQPANRDVHPSVVVSRFEKHLQDQGKVPDAMIPAAARLMLAGAEPAFIVDGIPSNVVVKSAAFTRLSAVVQAQEYGSPGIATHTDFETFTRLAELTPVTHAEAVVVAKTQANALIQWGIGQGKIVAKADDAYTPQEVADLREAFNVQLNVLAKAHEQLSAPMPYRLDMARKELQKAYGTKDPFDRRNITITNIDASESEPHSIEEIYAAGKTDRIPRKDRYHFELGNRLVGLAALPDINQAFNSSFDSYFNNLKEGVTTVTKHQLSQLPLEDRQTIASGKVEFFSLRKASVAEAEGTESPAEAKASKGRFGLLMRVESKIDKNGSDRDPKNLRYVYYETFPLLGTIRRRDDLPRYLPNPPPRVANAQTYATTQAKGVNVAVDFDAYENGTVPQRGKVSPGLLTEKIDAPYLPEPRPGRDTAATMDARFDTIAGVVAGHLLHDREAMQAGARGVTKVEEEEADIKDALDFAAGLIPFKNAIENAVKGNTGAAIAGFALDIFGFIVPFAKGVGQASKALSKLGEKLGTRVFKASDSILRSVVAGANPGDGLADLAEGLAKAGKSVLKSSYKELKQVLHEQTAQLSAYAKVSNVAADTVGTHRPLPDFSAHSHPDSLLDGHTMKGDGTYQIGDQHYVRFTDGTGIPKAFEISRVYKVAGGHVRVIDSVSEKTVMFLVPTGQREWRLNRMLGGVRHDAVAPGSTGIDIIRSQAQKRAAGQGSSASSSSSAAGASAGSSAPKRPRIPEAFAGEKALLDAPVKGVNKFYHYTGEKAFESIGKDWHLQSSVHDVAGKPLPRGKGRHYFTDLAPDDKATADISRSIFGRRRFGNTLDKMTHYFEVNTSGLKIMKTDNPHIFYVDTSFAIPLKYRVDSELTDRIISYGETPFTQRV